MTETLLGARQWRFPAMLAMLMVGLWGTADALEPAESPEREAIVQKLTLGTGFLDPIAMPTVNTVIGQCVEWGDAFYMLPPTMSSQQAMRFVEELPVLRERRYQPNNTYWARTATDGNVQVPGQRITLTWSFVPDGTMMLGLNQQSTQPSNLFASLNSRYPNEELWKDQFRRSFQEFGELIGVNYVEVSDDGATQPAVGQLGVRGDVRIAMINMGEIGVLAFNYYPVMQLNSPNLGWGGDMVFNSFWTDLFADPSNGYRTLRNVIMHEHGHGIGYRHVDPINQTKMMEAFLSTRFDGPQEDDIRGFQSGYGDWLEVNSTPETATVLGPLPTYPGEEPLFFDNLAIERGQARDHFRIDVPELTVLSVRAEPFGTMYPQGPQNGLVGNVNAKNVQDLVLEVLNADGTTVMLMVDENGLGFGEEIEFPLLPGAGEYLIRVRSKGVDNQSQRYRLWANRMQGIANPTYTVLRPIVDDSTGNANGAPDPGEMGVKVTIPLRNIGFASGPQFNAQLVSETPTVTVIDDTTEYGPAAATQTTQPSNPFRFNVSSEHECGDPIIFNLIMTLPEGVQEATVMLDTGILGPGTMRHFPESYPDLGTQSYVSMATIFVEEDFPIGEIRLRNINVTGSHLENHRFTLRTPTGAEVVLSDGNFKGSNLRDTNLQDGALPISAALSPYTGTYRPANPLSLGMGGSSFGEWNLRVINKQGGRAVLIDSWELEVAPFYDEPFCTEPILIPTEGLFESFSVY